MNQILYISTGFLLILSSLLALLVPAQNQNILYKLRYSVFFLAVVSLSSYSFFSFMSSELSAILLLATITGLGALLAQKIYKTNILISMIAPFITILLLIPNIDSSHKHILFQSGTTNWFLTSHIILAITGQSLAILATSFACVYLLQHRNLKKRNFSKIFTNLPGLDRLEYLLALTLKIGFILLSFALATGIFYSNFYWQQSPQALVPKILWALSVWTWYFVVLWLHNIVKINSKVLAKLCIIGFIILACGYFGLFADPSLWAFGEGF